MNGDSPERGATLTKEKQIGLCDKVRFRSPPFNGAPTEGWNITGWSASLAEGVWWYLKLPDGRRARARPDALEVVQ